MFIINFGEPTLSLPFVASYNVPHLLHSGRLDSSRYLWCQLANHQGHQLGHVQTGAKLRVGIQGLGGLVGEGGDVIRECASG